MRNVLLVVLVIIISLSFITVVNAQSPPDTTNGTISLSDIEVSGTISISTPSVTGETSVSNISGLGGTINGTELTGGSFPISNVSGLSGTVDKSDINASKSGTIDLSSLSSSSISGTLQTSATGGSGGDSTIDYYDAREGRYTAENYTFTDKCLWSCADPSMYEDTVWEWFKENNVDRSGWVKNPEVLFSGDEDKFDDTDEWDDKDFGADDASSTDDYIDGNFGGDEGGIHKNDSSGPQYGDVDESKVDEQPLFFGYLANDENWRHPTRVAGTWNRNAIAEEPTNGTVSKYPLEGTSSGNIDSTGTVTLSEESQSGNEPGIKGAYTDIFAISPMTRAYLNNDTLSCNTGGGGGLPGWVNPFSSSPPAGPSECGGELDVVEPRIDEKGSDIMVRFDGAIVRPDDDPRGWHQCSPDGSPDLEIGRTNDAYQYENSELNLEWISLKAKTTVHSKNAEEGERWGNETTTENVGVGEYLEIRNVSDPGGGNYYIFEDVDFTELGGRMNRTETSMTDLESKRGIGHAVDSDKPNMKGAIDINVTARLNASVDRFHYTADISCDSDGNHEYDSESTDYDDTYNTKMNVSDNMTAVIEEPPIVEYITRINIRGEDKTLTHVDMEALHYSNPRRLWESIKRKEIDKDTEYFAQTEPYAITGYYQFFTSRDKRWDKLEKTQIKWESPYRTSRTTSSGTTIINTWYDAKIDHHPETQELYNIKEDGASAHRLVPVHQFAFPGAEVSKNGMPKSKVGYQWIDNSSFLSGFIGTPRLEYNKICDRVGQGTEGCNWLYLEDPRSNRTIKGLDYRDFSEFTFESLETYTTHWDEDSDEKAGGPNWFRHPLGKGNYNRTLVMERLVDGNTAPLSPHHRDAGWSETIAAEPDINFSVKSVGNASNDTPTVVEAEVLPPVCNTKPYTVYCRHPESYSTFPHKEILTNKSTHGNLVIEEKAPQDVDNVSESEITSDVDGNYDKAFRTEVTPGDVEGRASGGNHGDVWEIPGDVEEVRVKYEGSEWENIDNHWTGYATLKYYHGGSSILGYDMDYPQYTTLGRKFTCTIGVPNCPDDKRALYEDSYPWLETSEEYTIKSGGLDTIDELFFWLTKWAFFTAFIFFFFGKIYEKFKDSITGR